MLLAVVLCFFFFFASRRRHTRLQGDWSSDVCSSDLPSSRACRRDSKGCGGGRCRASSAKAAMADRKSGVEGKRGDLGGRRLIKKKKKQKEKTSTQRSNAQHQDKDGDVRAGTS